MLRSLLCLAMICAATHAHQHTVAVVEPATNWRREGADLDGGRVCPFADVRNSVEALRVLRGCRVIDGFLQITLINATNVELKNFSFPELREITGYLLVYEVYGLTSLGQLFPNLAVIRGNTLFENYALIVFHAFDLEVLGLRALRVIVRGAVRIEENPLLCFLDTVNWPAITASGSEHITANKPPWECQACAEACESGFCWDFEDCTEPGEESHCHELCLGGCAGPGPAQCHACRGVRLHGECLDKCPADRLEYLGLHCLTERQCRAMKVHWPFDNSCVEKCPQSFAQVSSADNKTISCQACGASCPCFGARIDSIAAAQHMKGCTFIQGSLEIEIEIRGGTHIVKELEANLGKIQEIYGSLKVVRSFLLTSLSFLKDLRVIRGEEGTSNYTLIIHNNQNLKELWNRGQKPVGVKILNGHLFFHNNPKLCISEIEKFNKMAGLRNFTKHEVSEVSNGDKVSCNHKPYDRLIANVTIIYSKSALLEWEQEKAPADSMVRYIVYFTLAPDRNVTAYDERGACGQSDESWKINYVNAPSESDVNVHHPLTRLEPFSQYAYYVTMVTSHTYTVGQSPVQYFRTLPDRPSVPIIVQAGSSLHSQIELQWERPRQVNGILAHYIVSGTWLKDEKAFLDQRDYCQHPMLFNNPHGAEDPYLVLTKKRRFINCCGKEEVFEIKDAYDYNSRCEKREHSATCSKEELKVMSEACKDFFHSYLVSHLPKRKEDDFSTFINKMQHEPKGRRSQSKEDSSLPWGYVDPDNRPAASKDENKIDRAFVKKVEANMTHLVVKDLRHFARYSVKIMACRQSTEVNANTRCSFASLVTIRSRPMEGADDIDEIRVKVTEWNNTVGSVQVFWTAPKRPNGIIVSYGVEHRRIGNGKSEPVLECLTRKQHERNEGIHVVKNLQPGRYAFRIRAVSLSGKGSFTESIEYDVEYEPTRLRQEPRDETILGVTFGALLLLGCVSVLMYYCRSRMRRNMWLIASVNPDYTSATPYFEDNWELSRDKVTVGRRLGRGSFGLVYEGTLLSESPIPCAVKTIDSDATARERSDFLKEASVMKSFSDAFHVIRLLGVVSRGRPPLVVMELMSLGDLKTYLRAMRDGDRGPDFGRVALMAAQIADGMAFLEARKFVHRDLAARNCMIGHDLTVKVGDFGMTRDIYDTDYYRNRHRGALPVRWMSPESLSDGLFTSQSDVWSYGVVLWEMTTLAAQPYQGLANEQVVALVLGGGLLVRPATCPDLLHALMAACWKWRPESRPSFLQVVRQLDASVDLGLQFRLVSFYHGREESRVDICSDEGGRSLVAHWSAADPFENTEVAAHGVCKLPPPPKKVRSKETAPVYENTK